jgi:hypothetical protein
MRRFLFAAVSAVAVPIAAGSNPAAAQDYPYCPKRSRPGLAGLSGKYPKIPVDAMPEQAPTIVGASLSEDGLKRTCQPADPKVRFRGRADLHRRRGHVCK